jgi:hypothetical protein
VGAFGRKFVDQRLQNLVGQMPHELFDGAKRFLAGRTAWNNNAMFRIHEGAETVPLNFGLKRAE